jgi:hypothetical protein
MATPWSAVGPRGTNGTAVNRFVENLRAIRNNFAMHGRSQSGLSLALPTGE